MLNGFKKVRNGKCLVLMVLLFVIFFIYPVQLYPVARAQSVDKAIKYSWSLETFNFSVNPVWNEFTVEYEHVGNFSGTFTVVKTSYNETEGTCTKEERTVHYNSSLYLYGNYTLNGSIYFGGVVNAYKVEVKYSDSVRLVWLALKNSTITCISNYRGAKQSLTYVDNYTVHVESKFEKRDYSTNALVDSWTENSTTSGTYTMKPAAYTSKMVYKINSNWTFTAPFIFMMQLYKTSKHDWIGWAGMFFDYLIYKDLDGDFIYSAGEMSDSSTSLSFTSSDELMGLLRPWAYDSSMFTESWEPGDPSSYFNYSGRVSLPRDKSVSEISSGIEFIPPSLDGDRVSWGINYPNFPNEGHAIRPENFSRSYLNPSNGSFANLNPMNFTYGFSTEFGVNQTTTDYTMRLSRIQNDSFYQAVQGYGLAVPHFNYLISSADIKEEESKLLTVPAGKFDFKSNGTTVASIDLLHPAKKNYTLVNYPKEGKNSTFESIGSSIHPVATLLDKKMDHQYNPFINLIYNIRELAREQKGFTINDDLFQMDIQNYPTWSGEELVHDPRLTIYHEPVEPSTSEGEEPPIPTPQPSIPGYCLFMLGLASIMVILMKPKKIIKRS